MSDERIKERTAERDLAVAEIGHVLNLIQEGHRQPDAWERVHLVYAFFAMFAGCYELGAAEARLALTLSSERSATTSLPTGLIFEHCDLSRLIEFQQAVQAEPVQEFPHFGPVELRFPIHRPSSKASVK